MTDTQRDEMLDHMARQTKALENINLVLMVFFVVTVVAAALYVIL